MSKKFTRLSTGIYRDEFSIRGVVNIAAGRKEKRFDFHTPLKDIKRWRNEMIVKLERLHPQKRAGAIGRGTFSADVAKYLKHLAIASWNSRRSELRAWEAEFGRVRRSRITEDHVKKAIKKWTDAGVPPKTITNRIIALNALYHTLDGADAWTPLDNVPRPKLRKRKPLRVSVDVIIAVERKLREAGDPKTHARYMVINACGARPVFVKRAAPEDVNLERRRWNVPAAKEGEPIELYLNDDMLAAWRAFIAADAWGDFNSQEYAQKLRAAGWPAHIPPYNAKHTFGQELAELGFSREDIGDWYGHAPGSESTKIYTGSANLRRISQAMDGRLGWGVSGPKQVEDAAVDVANMTPEQRKALLRKLLADEFSL